MDHSLEPIQKPALTILYDGACPLCIREIALMQRLDRHKRIAFVDVANGDAPCPLDRQLMLARFHATMWREIPILRPLGLVARNRLVLALLERAYLQFLKIRPALQRWAR
jgi:DCC1-like thiol-disulfide oxidoreductase